VKVFAEDSEIDTWIFCEFSRKITHLSNALNAVTHWSCSGVALSDSNLGIGTSCCRHDLWILVGLLTGRSVHDMHMHNDPLCTACW